MEPFIPQFTPVLIAEEPSPRLRVGLVGLGRQGARIAAALLARNLAVVALDRAVFDRADLAPDLLIVEAAAPKLEVEALVLKLPVMADDFVLLDPPERTYGRAPKSLRKPNHAAFRPRARGRS